MTINNVNDKKMKKKYLLSGASGAIGIEFKKYSQKRGIDVIILPRDINLWEKYITTDIKNYCLLIFGRSKRPFQNISYFENAIKFINVKKIDSIFLGSSVQFDADAYHSDTLKSSYNFDPYTIEKKWLCKRLKNEFSYCQNAFCRLICPPVIFDIGVWGHFFEQIKIAKKLHCPSLQSEFIGVPVNDIFDQIVQSKMSKKTGFGIELVRPVKKLTWREMIVNINPQISIYENKPGKYFQNKFKNILCKLYYHSPVGLLGFIMLQIMKDKKSAKTNLELVDDVFTSAGVAFEIVKHQMKE